MSCLWFKLFHGSNYKNLDDSKYMESFSKVLTLGYYHPKFSEWSNRFLWVYFLLQSSAKYFGEN